jgi:hypothetical protein
MTSILIKFRIRKSFYNYKDINQTLHICHTLKEEQAVQLESEQELEQDSELLENMELVSPQVLVPELVPLDMLVKMLPNTSVLVFHLPAMPELQLELELTLELTQVDQLVQTLDLKLNHMDLLVPVVLLI